MNCTAKAATTSLVVVVLLVVLLVLFLVLRFLVLRLLVFLLGSRASGEDGALGAFVLSNASWVSVVVLVVDARSGLGGVLERQFAKV